MQLRKHFFVCVVVFWENSMALTPVRVLPISWELAMKPVYPDSVYLSYLSSNLGAKPKEKSLHV